jgi:hypothetical protein
LAFQGTVISPDTAKLASGVADSFTISPLLPAGLSLNKTTGIITGTPTSFQSISAYTVSAQNPGSTATVALSIMVYQALIGLGYSNNSITSRLGTAISPDTAKLAYGVPNSFTISPSLPSGLSINTTAGTISGTPAALLVTTAFTVTAINVWGSASASLTITVEPPLPGTKHFETVPPTTTNWVVVVPSNINPTIDGHLLNNGDEIGVFSSSRRQCIGAGAWNGVNLAIIVYGEDVGLPDSMYGAVTGDTLYYKMWDSTNSRELKATPSYTLGGPAYVPPPSVIWVLGKLTGLSAPIPVMPLAGDTGLMPTPTMQWNSRGGDSSYQVQVSTGATFATTVVNDSAIVATSVKLSRSLSFNTSYYWRVRAVAGMAKSWWDTAQCFTITAGYSIPIRIGWSFVSLNVHPQDSLIADLLGPLPGFVLGKTLTQVYSPSWGINGIDTLQVTKGYQMYSDSADTFTITGPAVNVSATPIPMFAGWNLISYLPQVSMSVDSAIGGLDSQLVLVKNQDGHVYWPEEGLNGIGDMMFGQGYEVYMNASEALTYPVSSLSKRVAFPVHKCVSLPVPKHFACALNTGNNATVLSKPIRINGALARDSSEVGVYDSKGNLVGSGVVVHGAAAFSVWGKGVLKKGRTAGCDSSEKLTFKLWDGIQEYPLEFHGAMQPQYADNAILMGSMMVPSSLFISEFALSKAYPNPFRENVRIFFDVPAAAGNNLQDVEINVYDLNGIMVRQLANGKYGAGHYSVFWDGSGQAGLSSNMYIVEMKAGQFNQFMKLFRVK